MSQAGVWQLNGKETKLKVSLMGKRCSSPPLCSPLDPFENDRHDLSTHGRYREWMSQGSEGETVQGGGSDGNKVPLRAGQIATSHPREGSYARRSRPPPNNGRAPLASGPFSTRPPRCCCTRWRTCGEPDTSARGGNPRVLMDSV